MDLQVLGLPLAIHQPSLKTFFDHRCVFHEAGEKLGWQSLGGRQPVARATGPVVNDGVLGTREPIIVTFSLNWFRRA